MKKIHYRLQAKSLTGILLGLLFLSICLKLGFWQLDRAKQKRILQTNFNWHTQSVAKTRVDLRTGDIKVLHYCPLQLEGYYDNHTFIFWDNRFYRNQLGYQVLIPFFPLGDKKAILVNLGWIPAAPQRNILPIIKPILGLRQVIGFIDFPAKKPLLLQRSMNIERLKQGLRVQQVQIESLAKEIGYPFYPLILLLKPEQQGYGLTRDWSPFQQILPSQHIAYAVQWFSLGGILLLCLALALLKAWKKDA